MGNTKFLLAVLFCAVLFVASCSRYSYRPPPKKINSGQQYGQPNQRGGQIPTRLITRNGQCSNSFIEGKRFYEKYTEYVNKRINITHFFMSINFLKVALNECQGHEYEDDVIFALANAEFYTGKFDAAAELYKLLATKFPRSSYNIGNFSLDEWKLLNTCKTDIDGIRSFHQASLGELFGLHKMAINFHKKALSSNCILIKDRSSKRLKELKTAKKYGS